MSLSITAVRFLAMLVCLQAGPAAAQSDRTGRNTESLTAADLVPEGAIAAVRVQGAAGHVAEFQSSAFWTRVTASPLQSMIKQSPQYLQAMGGLNMVRAMTDMTAWELIAAALGDDAVAAFLPRPGGRREPAFVVVVRHVNAARADRVKMVMDKIHLALGLLSDDKPDPDKTRTVDGVTVWETKGNTHHAFFDGTLMLSNDRDLIERSIRLRSARKGRLSGSALWKDGIAAGPRDAMANLVVSLDALRKLSPEKEWPTALPNPLAALLFSDWAVRLHDAHVASAWLRVNAGSIAVEGALLGTHAAAGGAMAARGGILSANEMPRGMAHVTLFRDFSGWWTSREKTMTEAAVADLAKFAGVMTTLIGGLDFSDEFLPQVLPGAQLLMARQTFDGRPMPAPALPAFAMVLRLKDAEKIGPRLDSAATMAISFINLDAGQKGMPQFLINIEDYRGHKVTWTQYPRPDSDKKDEPAATSAPAREKPRANVRYNFEPAMTRVGDRVILATTREFLRDIVDAIEKGASAAANPRGRPDELYVSVAELRRVLNDNREQFVAEQMLSRDISRKAARQRVDAVLGIADWFKDVSLRSWCSEGRADVSLRIGLAGAPSRRLPER